mmetsp:Transcript_79576/g.146320  ORF Transcript_79576/g.146320 Transcript_79576/m.146320 type:complete len:203 (-) Transcript_79576:351-959(-)
MEDLLGITREIVTSEPFSKLVFVDSSIVPCNVVEYLVWAVKERLNKVTEEDETINVVLLQCCIPVFCSALLHLLGVGRHCLTNHKQQRASHILQSFDKRHPCDHQSVRPSVTQSVEYHLTAALESLGLNVAHETVTVHMRSVSIHGKCLETSVRRAERGLHPHLKVVQLSNHFTDTFAHLFQILLKPNPVNLWLGWRSKRHG